MREEATGTRQAADWGTQKEGPRQGYIRGHKARIYRPGAYKNKEPNHFNIRRTGTNKETGPLALEVQACNKAQIGAICQGPENKSLHEGGNKQQVINTKTDKGYYRHLHITRTRGTTYYCTTVLLCSTASSNAKTGKAPKTATT